MPRSSIATLALVRDTFREAFARKIFWGFFGCSTAVILFFIFLMKIDVVEGALATISLFGNESRALEVTKPVRRYHILLGRYLGNVLVIAFNMLYLVLAVWLILGIKTEIWTYQFLYGILLTIFMVAVLLTIVLLVAVLSEWGVLATMVTFGVFFAVLIVAKKTPLERLPPSEWSRTVVRTLY